MNNRHRCFFIVLISTLFFANSVGVAGNKSGEEQEDDEAVVIKPKKYIKPTNCGLNANLKYLKGEFEKRGTTERFEQQSGGFGAACKYKTSGFILGVGGAMSFGRLDLVHERGGLGASVSYLRNVGVQEWVSLGQDFGGFDFLLQLGMGSSFGSQFRINEIRVDLGNGPLDFKPFAAEHLGSKAYLQVVETNLATSFQVTENFYLQFGVLWRIYQIEVKIYIDREGQEALIALDYYVEKQVRGRANFINLTPGIKYCMPGHCVSVVIPWGVYTTKKWAFGGEIGFEILRF